MHGYDQGAYIEGGETRSYRADRCVMRKWTGASVILNKDVEGVRFYSTVFSLLLHRKCRAFQEFFNRYS